MTVIFGCTLDKGVVLGADSLGHDAKTLDAATGRDKLFELDDRVVIGKAGYGSVADSLYTSLGRVCRTHNIRGPRAVADVLLQVGQASLWLKDHAKAAGVECPGLYYLITGIEEDGLSAIYSIDVFQGIVNGGNGPGHVRAFGPRQNTQLDATKIFLGRRNEDRMELKRCSRDLIALEANSTPHAVGFPGELWIVSGNQKISKFTIDQP